MEVIGAALAGLVVGWWGIPTMLRWLRDKAQERDW